MNPVPMPKVSLSTARGFSLLEVLVALLVFSIGLMGVAGLQLLGVSHSRDAYFRTQALTLSYDIADRMRANLDAVDSGDYDGISGTLNTSCRSTSGCTSAQMAADDVALWKQLLAGLPSAEGIVCIDKTFKDGTGSAAAACDGTGNQYVVKVWWDDDLNPTTDKARLITVFVP